MDRHRFRVRMALGAGIVGCLAGVCLGQRARVTIDPVAKQILDEPNFVVDSVHFGALDVPSLLAQDRARELSGGIPHFAVPEEVDYTPDRYGSIQLLDHGRIAWRLDIQADGAHSINIGTEFNVPDSLEMYLLNAEGQTLWGAFTSRDNFQGQMWSPIVPGEVMRIYAEMDEADWDQFEAGFRITHVNIGYRGIGEALASRPGHDENSTRSDACHTDVACEEADPWCQQVKGAACYTIGGFGMCSCSMLNNTAEDERPIVYTAYHCGAQDNPASVRVYFNFQNATCRPPGSVSSGGAGTCGNINFGGVPCNTTTISGTSVIATYQPADAVLLDLSSTPPDSYQVVYLGWNVANPPSPPSGQTTWAFGIHHPGVEEKRIAFENDSIFKQQVSISYLVNAWAVDYDNGGLEGGSSGSPLFDADGRVIGAATAVDQFDTICSQNQWYGRLQVAWDADPTFRTTLDPVGGGTTPSMDLRQFFPDTAPEAFGFGLLTPANGATGQTTGAWLDWNGACYTDEYEVILSTHSNLSSPLIDEIVTAPETVYMTPLNTLDYDTVYYWQVKASNSVGTTVSPIWSFTTAPPPVPGSFSLLSPANAATDVETGPVLDWGDAPLADNYLVEVDDSVAFSSPEVSQVVVASTLDLPSLTLAYDTQYFWRVTAMNQTGSTLSTPSLSAFHTTSVPPCPCVGDLDADCDSDVLDFGVLAAHFGQSVAPNTNGDLDGNGVVNVFDFSIFSGDFGCGT